MYFIWNYARAHEKNANSRHLWRCTALPPLLIYAKVNCGEGYLVRLKSAQLFAFFVGLHTKKPPKTRRLFVFIEAGDYSV